EDDDELLLTGPAEPPSLTLGSLDLAAGLDLDGDAAEGEDLADGDLEDDDLWGRLDDSAAPSPATPPPTPMLGAPLERPTPLGPPPVGSPPGESDAPAPSSVGLDTLPPLDSGIEAAFGASSPPAPFATLALGPVALDAADAALAETGVLAHPVVPPSDGAVAVGGAGEDVFALDLGDASDPLDGSDELDDLEELDEADLEALDDEPGLSSGPPPPPEPDLSPAPVPSEAEPVVIADMPAREPVAPSGARSDGGGVANAPPDLRVPDGPGPLLDAAAIPPRGLRLLVTLPPVDPCVPGEVFPEHSPAAPDWSWGEGAGVAVALPKPQSELPRAAAFDGLLAALRRAIEGEADPERLASLAFGYAAVAVRVHGDVEVGLAAARAAMANAPTFSPARRLLHELLAMQGRTDERLALLERGDATALDEAGHLAWRTGDAERAHSDWGWAAEYDPTALGPMLSSLLALSARPGVRDERAVLQWALARAQSPALWQALALEQLRLNMRDEPGYADAWAEDGLQRLDPSPALGALIEWHALTQGNAGLLAAALELRPNGLEGPAAAVARAWAAEANGDHPGFGHAVDGARGARPGSL
ncbi:MAG: hypothetical protein KC613_01570, partial [Myxococcales bacterium]|nr:hypothetical protein [Myxococcales bacterium]